MSTVLASGADERYGEHLLNLIGSVRANSDLFDAIVIYDLGLNERQRRLLDGARGIEVRTVPPFVPHWAQGRTWKTWIWAYLEAETVVWLDAGISVLRPFTEPLAQIRDRGYFAVSQGHPLSAIAPREYLELYGISDETAARDCIAAGILGFATDGPFYEQVIVPTFEDAVLGLSLGFSAGEVEKLNHGLDRLEPVIVRDCEIFRHEQTLLSIHFYKSVAEPVVNDVVKYGGWQTPHDHPQQLLWSHRRRGDYRYLWRVPYTWRAAPFAWRWTILFRMRARYRQNAWLFRPRTYVDRLRRMAGRTA